MNKALKILGIVVLALVVVGALVGAGFLVGRTVTARQAIIAGAGAASAYGFDGRPGMMQGWDDSRAPSFGPGMMQGWGDGQAPSYGPGTQPGRGFDRGRRQGMMDDFGRMPMFGGGAAAAAEPLTVASTAQAVRTFLDELGKDNLALGEIMIFDNHAYAVIDDTTTGQGAFEVLVDPVRQVVHLEFGPSMMWNTTYGMHGSDPIFDRGMMGRGMMGGRGEFGPEAFTNDATPLTESEARQKALAYLEQAYPDQKLSATAEAFPGYFTFDVETGSTPVSMLSVNASTGQVWYHTWHGTFVEMSE
jgi:hypothetical protein